jgi:type VI secretion system protein ImpK
MSGNNPTQLPEELNFLGVFDTFYSELDRLRLLVCGPSQPAADGVAGLDATLTAEGVRRKLVNVLEDLSADFGRATDSFEYKQFRQVLYVMAALADETFLEIDWYGRTEWRDNLVEMELFDSHDSGDRFFELLDDLIDGRDSAYRNVGAIYLLALSLGFRGRLVSDDRPEEKIAEYRAKLYTFIYSSRPARRLEGTPMCPQAGFCTITGSKAERFPTSRTWLLGGVLTLVLLLGASWFVWGMGTEELSQTLDKLAVVAK